MSETDLAGKLENLSIEGEGEGEENDYGEGRTIILGSHRGGKDFSGEEEEEKEWAGAGEHGEGGPFYIFKPAGEGSEYASIWEGKTTSVSSTVSAVGSEAEAEETEEEKELRRERELLIDEVRQKILDRMALRRRNAFLQNKLVHHFKKRRMENVFKEEPKGLDLEKKYLRRLHAFQEFKQAQEDEIRDLTESTIEFENSTKMMEEELDEKLLSFMAKAKEVSYNLILSKTGKRLNEKGVDRLLNRQIKKNDEKGRKKLQYIKIKNLIEEKERELKAMEYIGEGLYAGDYEQMKIDNQNFWDKIEEKEDELTKMRIKTQSIMQNLAHVREKTHAVEGDIELMEEKVYEVEKKFAETRKGLTEARTKRDFLREELARLKSTSGLLTKDDLLRDFEASIYEAKTLSKTLEGIKKLMAAKKQQEIQMSKQIVPEASGGGSSQRQGNPNGFFSSFALSPSGVREAPTPAGSPANTNSHKKFIITDRNNMLKV